MVTNSRCVCESVSIVCHGVIIGFLRISGFICKIELGILGMQFSTVFRLAVHPPPCRRAAHEMRRLLTQEWTARVDCDEWSAAGHHQEHKERGSRPQSPVQAPRARCGASIKPGDCVIAHSLQNTTKHNDMTAMTDRLLQYSKGAEEEEEKCGAGQQPAHHCEAGQPWPPQRIHAR